MKDDNALVTVCMICYNQEQYISRAIESIVNQKTTFSFELLVSDDKSTDKTVNVIREYKEKYPKIIRLLERTSNIGAIPNFVDTLNKATGKYIAFCEGDDFWIDKNKLQKQVDALENNPTFGFCYTDFVHCNDDESWVSQPVFKNNNLYRPLDFNDHLFNAGYIAPMTWMFRKDVFDSCKLTDKHSDGTFPLAVDFFANTKVMFLTDCTAAYRSHEGSATSQKDPKKVFMYEKGIFDTQIEYAYKYKLNENEINKLKFQGYTSTILPAIEANNIEFINEALDFYHSQGMEMKWFVEKCKQYVGYHHQYEQILHSNAYRLGKFLLKPFKVFKGK